MVHGFMGPEPFRILRTQFFFKVSRDRRLWESLRVYGPQYLAQRETQKEHLKKTSKSSTKASRETKSRTLDERRLLSTTECLSKLIGLSRKVYDCHNTIVSIKERNLPMWSQIDFKAEQSQWIDDDVGHSCKDTSTATRQDKGSSTWRATSSDSNSKFLFSHIFELRAGCHSDCRPVAPSQLGHVWVSYVWW